MANGDAAGQIEKLMRPSGKMLRFERDAIGRITGVHAPNGKSERYVYRADGALTEAINETVHVKMERDALGKVVREEQGPHWIERRYDLRGCLEELRSSFGFDTAFVRDVMGREDAFVADHVGAQCAACGGSSMIPHAAPNLLQDVFTPV